ncbi:MAG: hypothetical protein KDD33_02405, partial [Bdellovibrionales bacterium]|nr:hypothetical protein [Bdellovibrionales bacterium]
ELYTWLCLGAPESEVAHIAESLLNGFTDLKIGYRIHRPFVELKVWGPSTLNDKHKKVFQTLESKLHPWWVGLDFKTLRERFAEVTSCFDKVFVIDHLTYGLMLDKMKEGPKIHNLRYQCFEHGALKNFDREEIQKIQKAMSMQSRELYIGLFPAGDKSALYFINESIDLVEIPRSFPLRSQIGQLFAIEQILLQVISRGDKLG